MLTNMMEGRLFLAPDTGADPAVCPVDYGTDGSSAPESGNAAAQAENTGAVSPEGTDAAATSSEGGAEGAAATQQQSPAWMAQLPKDLRNDPELAKHKTMGDAIKYLKEQASTGKEAQEEQKNAQEQNTQPTGEKGPVKYENFAKRFNDSNDPFGNVTDELVGALQESGIDQSVAEGLVEKLDKAFTVGTEKMVQEGVKHTETVMRKQWGKDYDARRRAMAKGYMALGDTDGSLQKAMDSEGASLAPSVWELLSRVGNMVAEDNSVSSHLGQGKAHNEEVPVDYPD